MPQNLAGRYFDLWKIKRDALQSLALSQLLSKVWKTSLVIIQHCSKTIPSLKGIFLLIQSRSFTYILNSSVSRQWFATAINVSSTGFFPWEWSRMILTSQDMLEGNQIEKYRKYVYPWFDLCLRCGWCPKNIPGQSEFLNGEKSRVPAANLQDYLHVPCLLDACNMPQSIPKNLKPKW